MQKRAEKLIERLSEEACRAHKKEVVDDLIPWDAREELIRSQVRESVEEFVERVPRGYANLAILLRRRHREAGMSEKDLDAYLIDDDALEVLHRPKLLLQRMKDGQSLQEVVGFSLDTLQEYFSLAAELLEEQLYEEAIDAFLFLTNLNPAIPQLWVGLGKAYQESGDLERALETFRMAVASGEREIPTYFHLCRCALYMGETGVAQETAESALELAREVEAEDPDFLRLAKDLKKYVDNELK